jgi:hypothetical protein
MSSARSASLRKSNLSRIVILRGRVPAATANQRPGEELVGVRMKKMPTLRELRR